MSSGRYFVEHHITRRAKDDYRLIVTKDSVDELVRLCFVPLDGGQWISRDVLSEMGFPRSTLLADPALRVAEAGFKMVSHRVSPTTPDQVDSWKECYGSVSPVLKGDTGGYSQTITADYHAVKDEAGEPLKLEAEGVSDTEEGAFREALVAFHNKYPYIHVNFAKRVDDWSAMGL